MLEEHKEHSCKGGHELIQFMYLKMNHQLTIYLRKNFSPNIYLINETY